MKIKKPTGLMRKLQEHLGTMAGRQYSLQNVYYITRSKQHKLYPDAIDFINSHIRKVKAIQEETL